MIIAGTNSLKIIGFPESTMTQELRFFISTEFIGTVEIILPEEFLKLKDKSSNSYFVGFTLDKKLRQKVIDVIDTEYLDAIIYVHPSVVRYYSDADTKECVGVGTFIGPFSSTLIHSKIGKHCIIATYCLIAHYTNVGDNSIVHPGVMIAGKTNIGKNCVFNFKASVLNALTVGDDIEVGATSCITKNILQSGKYVGSPARRVGDNT